MHDAVDPSNRIIEATYANRSATATGDLRTASLHFQTYETTTSTAPATRRRTDSDAEMELSEL